jgi:hypothetical protein
LLERFVHNVNVLQGSSYYAHPGHQIKLYPQADGSTRFEVDSPGEEAVRAVVLPFRKLYNTNESTSANSAIKILSERAAASGTPEGAEAVQVLRAARKALHQRRTTDPRGYILVEDGEPAVTPGTVIDLWLNGEYFHEDDEHRSHLDEEPNISEMSRILLHHALRDFCSSWSDIARVSVAALAATSTADEPGGVSPTD